MNAETIVQDWMNQCCETIKSYDHPAHMNLISEQVQVFGIPGYEVIGYNDWFSQCEHEFKEKIIKQARYQGLIISQSDEDQITFLTVETVSANDGTVDTHPLEAVLKKETDGQWRVVRERLITQDEAKKLGLAS